MIAMGTRTQQPQEAQRPVTLHELSRPYLQELRQRTSYAASLSVLDGTEILYIERARSFRRAQHKIDLNLRPGSRLPAHCTSMGKTLLANLPKTDREESIATMTLTRHGPNTIMSKKALRAEFELVFDEGIAVENEELAADLVSIACAVRDGDREVVAAIGLAAHASTISAEEMVDRLLADLLATADSISARLGYRFEGGRQY